MSSLHIVDSESGEVLYEISRERVEGMVTRQTLVLGVWKAMWKWLGRPEVGNTTWSV